MTKGEADQFSVFTRHAHVLTNFSNKHGIIVIITLKSVLIIAEAKAIKFYKHFCNTINNRSLAFNQLWHNLLKIQCFDLYNLYFRGCTRANKALSFSFETVSQNESEILNKSTTGVFVPQKINTALATILW